MQLSAAARIRRKSKTRKRRQPTDPDILSPKQLAAMLGVSERTLEEWRKKGAGPNFEKEGRMIRYSRADIEAWRLSRKGSSTADFGYKPGAR